MRLSVAWNCVECSEKLVLILVYILYNVYILLLVLVYVAVLTMGAASWTRVHRN